MTLSLQASLLCCNHHHSSRLPLPLPSKSRFHPSSSLSSNPKPSSLSPVFLFSRLNPRPFSIPRSLHPDNVNSDSKLDSSAQDSKPSVSDFNASPVVVGEGIEVSNMDGEAENAVEDNRQSDKLVPKRKIQAVVILMGIWAMIKKMNDEIVGFGLVQLVAVFCVKRNGFTA